MPLTIDYPSNAAGVQVATKVQDGAGNPIGSISDGTYYSLLTATGPTDFVVSTVNSSVAQLGAGATFAGAIENCFNFTNASILLTSDQPGTLTITQYIDLAGTRVADVWTFTNLASVPFARSFTINGNFIKVSYQNTGGSATTTFNLNTAYGNISPATQLGNVPGALNEVGGVALTLGSKTGAGSIPVILPSDQTVVSSSTLTRQANATAYSANQVISNAASGGTYQTFAGATLLAGGSGLILSAQLVDGNNAATPLQPLLLLFSAAPASTFNDLAALALNMADSALLVGVIAFGASYLTNSGSGAAGIRVYEAPYLNMGFKVAGTSLYGVLVAGAAYTPVSAEVLVSQLTIAQG